MKKRMLALLLGLLCAGLTACGSTDTAAKDETPSAPTVEQPEPEPTPEEVRRTAAEQYADGLTLEEQVAQMFFVRCPETDAAALTAQYDIGGYLLFARDFDGQTPETITNTIASYQNAAKTPMLIGVDEEGGTVVRVSSNPAFRAAKFRSPQTLYNEGGFDRITSDTAEKDALLRDLGINVNFAPGVRRFDRPERFHLRAQLRHGRRADRRIRPHSGHADGQRQDRHGAQTLPRLRQ